MRAAKSLRTGGWGAAGIGGGANASCGDITIKGGTITATNSFHAAGIGSGEGGSCGNILIEGGTVIATGGNLASGIGSGANGSSCGNITITTGVTSVTAEVSSSETCDRSIGWSLSNESKYSTPTCGTITIGGTVYYDGTDYQNGGQATLETKPYTYKP